MEKEKCCDNGGREWYVHADGCPMKPVERVSKVSERMESESLQIRFNTMKKIGKLRHAGRTENTTWSDSSTYQIIEVVNQLVDAHNELLETHTVKEECIHDFWRISNHWECRNCGLRRDSQPTPPSNSEKEEVKREKKCEKCGGSGIISIPKHWRTGADYEVAYCPCIREEVTEEKGVDDTYSDDDVPVKKLPSEMIRQICLDKNSPDVVGAIMEYLDEIQSKGKKYE